MNPSVVLAALVGALLGFGLGQWRTWVFARKLLHLGVSLDAFSDYDECARQAKGQSQPTAEPTTGGPRSQPTRIETARKA